MATLHHVDGRALAPFRIHAVPASRPFVWIARGWEDLQRHRAASLTYGLLVAAAGALILRLSVHPYAIAATVCAFLLVGPMLAFGPCELSRRTEHGEPVDFGSSLAPLRHRRRAIAAFSSTLLAIGATWFLLSWLLLDAMLGSAAPAYTQTIWGDVLAYLSGSQLLSYAAVGAILAAIAFALSVVSVPMILDAGADARTAMRTSMRVTIRDLPAMLVWAALIVTLVTLGFASLLLGMIIVFPLLGHATWHAYRDLVR